MSYSIELHEEYKKESGFDVGNISAIGCVYYSEDYVYWLEEQLLKYKKINKKRFLKLVSDEKPQTLKKALERKKNRKK